MHFNKHRAAWAIQTNPWNAVPIQKAYFLETVQKQSLDGLLISLPGGWSSDSSQFWDEQGCFKRTMWIQPEASDRSVKWRVPCLPLTSKTDRKNSERKKNPYCWCALLNNSRLLQMEFYSLYLKNCMFVTNKSMRKREWQSCAGVSNLRNYVLTGREIPRTICWVHKCVWSWVSSHLKWLKSCCAFHLKYSQFWTLWLPITLF